MSEAHTRSSQGNWASSGFIITRGSTPTTCRQRCVTGRSIVRTPRTLMTRGIAGRVLTAGAFKILRFQKVMAWFHRQAKEPLRPDLKQRWEARLRNDPKEQAKFMDDLSKDIQRMVSKRRICCLTRDPT